MSLPPSYPPPPPGSFQNVAPRPPGNGLAIGALVLGLVTLPLAIVPLLSLVALLTAAIGIGLGIAGIRRGRRISRGTAMASWGLGLSAVGLVIAALMTFVFVRWLGDVLDWVEPPEPSEKVGQAFDTDDGALRIKVTSATCEDGSSGVDDYSSVECTFVFDAENQSDQTIYLDGVRVKGVVDGEWQDAFLQGETSLEPGDTQTITGSVSAGRAEDFEGIAFDADDASSHSAVVVDPGTGQ